MPIALWHEGLLFLLALNSLAMYVAPFFLPDDSYFANFVFCYNGFYTGIKLCLESISYFEFFKYLHSLTLPSKVGFCPLCMNEITRAQEWELDRPVLWLSCCLGWAQRCIFNSINSTQLHQEEPRSHKEGFEAEGDIRFVFGSDVGISVEDVLAMREVILGDQTGQWG